MQPTVIMLNLAWGIRERMLSTGLPFDPTFLNPRFSCTVEYINHGKYFIYLFIIEKTVSAQ